MEIIEKYKISSSTDKAAQFKFPQKNKKTEGGYLTGVAVYPPNCTIKNGWTRTALLIKTKTPWRGSNKEYEVLMRKAF